MKTEEMITKLKAALEVLEYIKSLLSDDVERSKAITDLRAVIAQLEQAEPVAEIGLDSNGDMVTQWSPDFNPSVGGKLYAAPVQPVREPLTLNEIDALEQRVWLGTMHKGKPSYEYAQRLIRDTEKHHGITKD